MLEIPNIIHKKDYCKYIECSNSVEMISMHRDQESLLEATDFNKFVKECESMIRRSKEYSAFVSYVKREIGLDFCQVCSNILGTDATIEMHHNFFTLYDIVSVIINYLLETDQKVNSYRITDIVLDEHYALNVSIIMAAITPHEAIHNRDIFINLEQSFGDINQFIIKYKEYLTDEQKYKIYKYVEMCKTNPSFDNGILDTVKIVKLVGLDNVF